MPKLYAFTDFFRDFGRASKYVGFADETVQAAFTEVKQALKQEKAALRALDKTSEYSLAEMKRLLPGHEQALDVVTKSIDELAEMATPYSLLEKALPLYLGYQALHFGIAGTTDALPIIDELLFPRAEKKRPEKRRIPDSQINEAPFVEDTRTSIEIARARISEALGRINGLPESGEASWLRHMFTPFGSATNLNKAVNHPALDYLLKGQKKVHAPMPPHGLVQTLWDHRINHHRM